MGTIAAITYRDLAGSVVRLPLALKLALEDIRNRYRRTVLGPMWIVLGQAATIAGFILVFGNLLHARSDTYALYLASSLPTWALIASFLSEMPATFITAKGFMESFELPWLIHIWRRSFSYLIVFAHQILILVAVIIFLLCTMSVSDRAAMTVPSWNMLWVIPSLAIVTIAGAGVGLMLALFGARYRDLQPAMQVIASLLFLFTPILWDKTQLHANLWVVQFNPIYYYMKLVRDPLLGFAPDLNLYLWTGAGAVAMFALGFLTFRLTRRRLYHWL